MKPITSRAFGRTYQSQRIFNEIIHIKAVNTNTTDTNPNQQQLNR